MVKIINGVEIAKSEMNYIKATTVKYIQLLKLQHFDVNVVIDSDMDDMAYLDVNFGRNQARIFLNYSMHLDLNNNLDIKEVENTIAHEVLHLLMDTMDRVLIAILEEKTFGLIREFEESVVDRLAEVICR